MLEGLAVTNRLTMQADIIVERYMSQKARRRWAGTAVCLGIVAAGAASIAVWRVGVAPAGAQAVALQAGGGESSPMDPADYAALAELRQRLRLADEALAGIGCDGPAAESALYRLRTWYEANRTAWDSSRVATASATRQL